MSHFQFCVTVVDLLVDQTSGSGLVFLVLLYF